MPGYGCVKQRPQQQQQQLPAHVPVCSLIRQGRSMKRFCMGQGLPIISTRWGPTHAANATTHAHCSKLPPACQWAQAQAATLHAAELHYYFIIIHLLRNTCSYKVKCTYAKIKITKNTKTNIMFTMYSRHNIFVCFMSTVIMQL